MSIVGREAKLANPQHRHVVHAVCLSGFPDLCYAGKTPDKGALIYPRDAEVSTHRFFYELVFFADYGVTHLLAQLFYNWRVPVVFTFW